MLKDILNILTEIQSYIEDLIKFIISPREYLIKIDNENEL